MKQWRILISLLKMVASFAGNFILKNNSQLTLPKPSQRTSIHFMERIYWMMIFKDFLKMGRISSRPNWNPARSLQRNAKETQKVAKFKIQSILEANDQLTKILLNCACTAKKWGMKVVDTPFDQESYILLQERTHVGTRFHSTRMTMLQFPTF